MCGLAGVILKQKDRDNETLNRVSKSFTGMLKEADMRGGHATGFALIDKHGDYAICKKPKDAYEFFNDEDVKDNIGLVYDGITTMMGHTRYATLGSPSINKNNHPIRTGQTIGTHNGSISNHKELFHKYDMDRFAQVDSEAIFRLYETSNNVDDFLNNRLPKVQGRVAIVWADLERPDYVYMVKANNPIQMVYVPEYDCYAYGSTDSIINAGFWGDYKRITIEPNTMVRINTKTLKMDTQKIRISKPKIKKFSFYDEKIGAYKDKPQTVDRFVPRFSYSDQLKMFKTSDGSTIRKVK
ncbi:MAG: putative glutamine amidotransferase [Prokaryotic dsDNA virus sp.]|nr:MAG: putative glutamine amidotransferase [Prokaryotic dsDNA virus sp.]|tara:strand:+ start:20937 stop:21827 length:891 start_codon:yes stop_codon:yes gene_type:complete